MIYRCLLTHCMEIRKWNDRIIFEKCFGTYILCIMKLKMCIHISPQRGCMFSFVIWTASLSPRKIESRVWHDILESFEDCRKFSEFQLKCFGSLVGYPTKIDVLRSKVQISLPLYRFFFNESSCNSLNRVERFWWKAMKGVRISLQWMNFCI